MTGVWWSIGADLDVNLFIENAGLRLVEVAHQTANSPLVVT
jgi:hypothetical protein